MQAIGIKGVYSPNLRDARSANWHPAYLLTVFNVNLAFALFAQLSQLVEEAI
jgi:hypothetical protein